MDDQIFWEQSPKKTYSKIGMALFVTAITAFATQIIAAVIAVLLGIMEESWAIWVVSFVPLYLIAVPIGYVMFRRAERTAPERTDLGIGGFFRYFMMCFPLLYAGSILGNILSFVLSGGTAENAIEDLAMSSSFLMVLVMVIIAPIIEELVFRKFIIDRAARFGRRTAVLFSAGAFALFHMNLFQAFYAFAVGLIFAHVYMKTGKLRYSIIMHMSVNFFGSVVGASVIETMERLEGTNRLYIFMSCYGLLILGLVGCGLAMLVNFGRELLQKDEEEAGFKRAWLNVGSIIYGVFCIIMTIAALYI